ncbi:MAG: DNA polymerase IV, partial [Candidatus Latescibacterota bacterium]
MADRDRIRDARLAPVRRESVILHVDMDSFFVSIERALDPRLARQPVIVGGDPSSRGVVVACSYEVRGRGVRSGMPMGRALSLYPEATVHACRPRYYAQISAGIFRILSRVADKVEQTSVDEAYIALSEEALGWAGELDAGERIRRAVRREYSLAASVGAGPSRMIAKIASRLAKPDGIRVIPPGAVPSVVHPLLAVKMGGIGEKTAARLLSLGIRTIGDLAAADEKHLRRAFGKNGTLLSRLARCEEDFPVLAFRDTPDPKSMSNERTLRRDTDDPERIDEALLFLTERLARRLRSERLVGNVFHMKIRFGDFRTILRSKTLPTPTNDERTLLRLAREAHLRFGEGKPVRLLGVGLSGL